MHLAQVQLFKSLIFWSKYGCLGFLYKGGCLKQVRWNIFWRCLYVTAVPWPWEESGSWAGRRQLMSSRSRIWRETDPERDCHPANSAVRWQVTAAMEFEKHVFWHTRFEWLTQPQTSPTLGGKQRAGFWGQHRANLYLWKNYRTDNTWKSLTWNGALLHISAVSPGFSVLSVLVDVEWITTAAWWSSKPWTHFLVLSNGDTLRRMWLIRESSSPWQTFSNGNGFWGLPTARVKMLSWSPQKDLNVRTPLQVTCYAAIATNM